jgi:hypothetical protein
VVAIARANKMARTAWALLGSGATIKLICYGFAAFLIVVSAALVVRI